MQRGLLVDGVREDGVPLVDADALEGVRRRVCRRERRGFVVLLRHEQSVVPRALLREGLVQLLQRRARHQPPVRRRLGAVAEHQARLDRERRRVHQSLGGELGLHLRPERRARQRLFLQAQLARDPGDERERLLRGAARHMDRREELGEVKHRASSLLVRLAQAGLDHHRARLRVEDVLGSLVVVHHVRHPEQQRLLHALLERLEQRPGLTLHHIHERRGGAERARDRRGAPRSGRLRRRIARGDVDFRRDAAGDDARGSRGGHRRVGRGEAGAREQAFAESGSRRRERERVSCRAGARARRSSADAIRKPSSSGEKFGSSRGLSTRVSKIKPTESTSV